MIFFEKMVILKDFAPISLIFDGFSMILHQIWSHKKKSTPRCFTFFRRPQTLWGFVSSVAPCSLELLTRVVGSGFLKKVFTNFLGAKIQPPWVSGGGAH